MRTGNNIRFSPTSMSEKRLCNNDENQRIVLRMYNTSNFFAPEEIGELSFTLQDIDNRKLVRTKGGRSVGSVQFT